MRNDPQQLMTTLRSALDEWESAAAPDERPAPRLVHGPAELIGDAMIDLVLAEAKREYLGFEGPLQPALAGVSDSIVVRGSRTMVALAERGVRVRRVMTRGDVPVAEDRLPSTSRDTADEPRVTDPLPVTACIIDRRFALVPVDRSMPAPGVLIIIDPIVVKVLVAAHRTLWETGNGPDSDVGGPPERLVAVVETLASGLTDDRAADRLGLSSRTYSRRVADLMMALGVESRFEAGVEAARRGWL